MVTTTYSYAPAQKSNIVPFIILSITTFVIALIGILSPILVEAGIRPSLWISQTDAWIAILVGKTFPFFARNSHFNRYRPSGSL
jgi:hypothetical protein